MTGVPPLYRLTENEKRLKAVATLTLPVSYCSCGNAFFSLQKSCSRCAPDAWKAAQ